VSVAVANQNSTGRADIEQAVVELESLGARLVDSYQALERRAQRVEQDLACANDALEAKVAELDAVNANLAAILDALPTGVVVRDASGRVVRVNRTALEVLGARSDDVQSRSAALFGDELAADGDWCEREVVREDGRRLVIARRRSLVARPAHDAHPGDTLGSVEILDDRTQLAELHERLHSLDKLAALGNMAGGIAHELRNPMHAIGGFAALLHNGLKPASQEQHWADLIVAGCANAESVLASMLTLASPSKLTLETIEPAELAAAAVEQVRGEIPDATPWRIDCTVNAPPFVGDRIKLRQTLRNLLSNAIHAQPGGGAVALELTQERADIVLRVSDAGPGIAPELRRRVLEPFFTTRAQGTGLGLALVVQIAELHGGRVEISPRPSQLGGAQIALRIPFRPSV
jgi:signal transduction histidine kinase